MNVTIVHGETPGAPRAQPPQTIIRPSTMPWAAEYPFESHWMGVPVEGGGTEWLHFVDEGPRDAPVIFFFHGNPTWSFYWRKLIIGLRDRYRCVAIDHTGMGLSDRPQRDRYLLKDHVDRACALVDALNVGDFSVVGHDWGGCIAAGVAGRKPERIKAISWMNTAAFHSQEIPFSIATCRIPGFGSLAVRGFNAFAGAAIFRAVEKPERMTPIVKAGYLDPYGNWHDRIATLRFVEDIPLEPSHPSWDEVDRIEKNLAHLKQKPVALFWGDKDWCFTTNFRKRFEREFPTAEVHAWDDCGHYVVEDAHERILPFLRTFFDRHTGNMEISNPGVPSPALAARS
jgi:pimeloyl-ACP methyl ester carboxylesterase